MQVIDNELLNEVSRQAKTNPRLRMNYNFHTSTESSVQRLLNALEPGTKIPVHRHRNTDETYILLRGCIKILFYDDNGCEIESEIINPQQASYGIHIPAGQWHSLEVLASESVIFEVKEGPYIPLRSEDIL